MELLEGDSDEIFAEYYEFLMEKKSEGKKLVGYLAHEFIPDELIRAMDIIPVPYLIAGEDDRKNAGAELLTPSMCPFALSYLGTVRDIEEYPKFRYLKLLDAVIATNYCAADYLINEWISNILDIPMIRFHIPFLNDRAHINYFNKELEKLVLQLAQLKEDPDKVRNYHNISFSDPISEGLKQIYGDRADSNLEKILDNLKVEIEQSRQYYELFAKLDQRIYPYSEKNKLRIIYKLFGPESSLKSQLEKIIEESDDISRLTSEQGIPILFVGNGVYINDDTFSFIEDCGGYIVKDIGWLGQHLFPDYIKNTQSINQIINHTYDSNYKKMEEILNTIAEEPRLHKFSPHITNPGDPLKDYIGNIIDYGKKYNVKGVINHILKFCDIIGHHREYVKKRLMEHGLKTLNLERDYSNSMQGQLRTRIEAFLEMFEESHENL